MTDSMDISTLVLPLISQFKPQSVLAAGEIAVDCTKSLQDTRLQQLTTPFTLDQLPQLAAFDLAIISQLTESQPIAEAQQWLGLTRNLYAPHIILITDPQLAARQGWQFNDYLAMGLKHSAGSAQNLQVFSYTIGNYQSKRDWLDSRFWANPQNYDKYRW